MKTALPTLQLPSGRWIYQSIDGDGGLYLKTYLHDFDIVVGPLHGSESLRAALRALRAALAT